jgi:hypothetical protein
LDIHFTVGISCEGAAPHAEKNAAVRHHVLRSLISLHNKHPIFLSHKAEFSVLVTVRTFLFVSYTSSWLVSFLLKTDPVYLNWNILVFPAVQFQNLLIVKRLRQDMLFLSFFLSFFFFKRTSDPTWCIPKTFRLIWEALCLSYAVVITWSSENL